MWMSMFLAAVVGVMSPQGPVAQAPSTEGRADVLAQTIATGLREPKSEERNARLEKLVTELDAMSDEFLDQKMTAHGRMNGYYRADDIDAGIIRHSTWIIERARTFTPEQRQKYGSMVVSAHRNMAQALAGHERTDDAIQLLERARADWGEVRGASASMDSEIARLRLVGGPGASVKAPRWLNAPAGTTEIDMKGAVTLLEFTAHWCGPCRESYPGINRLRQRFGQRGFRVVMATQLYGYFQKEQNLPPEAEIERDREYFAAHKLDVPVAIGDGTSTGTTGESKRDPNSAAYLVGGIPQIHLIDRQGKVRLIMVGYDDANEPKLASLIERLLAEK